MIQVPYHSQEDSDSREFGNDCGAACASMLLEWAGKGRISVNKLSEETTLPSDRSGLNVKQVAALISQNGLPAQAVHSTANFQAVQTQIAAGRPVVALINYGPISERQNKADHFGHFVVVLGVDGDYVYVNDPDFWGNQMQYGAGLKVKSTEFDQALRISPIPNSCVFLTTDAGVKPPPPPTPAVHTIPPGQAHVNTDTLNVRNGPAGATTVTMKSNDNIVIQPDAAVSATLGGVSYVWVKVRTGDGTYGWCAEQFLAAGWVNG